MAKRNWSISKQASRAAHRESISVLELFPDHKTAEHVVYPDTLTGRGALIRLRQ